MSDQRIFLGYGALIKKMKEAGASAEVIMMAVDAVAAVENHYRPLLERLTEKESARLARVAEKKRNERSRIERPKERLWLALTTAVYARDGRTCQYCGSTEGLFCIDHVHPVSRGGSNELNNLVVACTFCNSSKGDRLLNEWSRLP